MSFAFSRAARVSITLTQVQTILRSEVALPGRRTRIAARHTPVQPSYLR